MLEDGVGDDETRTFPLPMGIERMDKHQQRGVHADKGSKAPQTLSIWGLPCCLSAQISAELWCVMQEDGVGDDFKAGLLHCPWIEGEKKCMKSGLRLASGPRANIQTTTHVN